MKQTTIILVLAVLTSAAYAQSSAPPKPARSSQPIVVVQQQSPLLIEFDRGSEDTPFVITNRSSKEETQAAQDKVRDDHRLTVATERLAWWTVGLGVASMAAAVAAVISSVLAAIAARDLRTLERAYLFARVEFIGWDPEKSDGLRTLNLKVQFHNHGKTPAILKTLKETVDWTDTVPTELPENLRTNREWPDGLVVARGTSWSWPMHLEITNTQWGMLMASGNQHAFVMGQMTYQDVMGGKHEVGFCWESQNQRRNGMAFVISNTKLNRAP